MIKDLTTFQAINPSTGEYLDGSFCTAVTADADLAMASATAAFQIYKTISKDRKGQFLRGIANEIALLGDTLINLASAESGLPYGRLHGELGRTTGQLKLFADLVEEGSWVNAIIDAAIPDRQPIPRADIRRMLVPIGPIVVFGASNFPLAFSVAGGDTASALAAGCPVVVKAHPAHPGTSKLVADAIHRAVEKTGMPKGVFSILFDDGHEIGAYLVEHPATKGVTFTGSFKGGMALNQLALRRKKPIPVFAEMGSINPVILFPEMLKHKAEAVAQQLAASLTLGAGQFCTNPGLLIALRSEKLHHFISALSESISKVPSATMLTPGIWTNYLQLSEKALASGKVSLIAESSSINPDLTNQSVARVTCVNAADFLAAPELQEEVFGPFSLLVIADSLKELNAVIDVLAGQLTITLMSWEREIQAYPELLGKLSDKAGRLILNGMPTGVEVCAAMQHGGPFPATNDSRFTSVGSTAIYRFARPVSWQDWDNALLPDELKAENPLGIFRMMDLKWTKE
jgi:alpha-ketoglutaric semialdehyde dehydrogenase